MMKRLITACAFAVGSFAIVGCDDKAKSGAGTAVDVVKDKIDDAKEKLEKAQKEITQNFDMDKITEAIGKLSGDAKTTAETKLADFRKMLDEFKATPMEKINEWKEKLMAAYAELKTAAGL